MTRLEALKKGEFQGCTHLQIAENLTAFPREIFDLADTLESLDLSNNALTELPADLSKLTKLRTLFCSNNQFTRLPDALGVCEQLEIIGFKHNQITEVPETSLPDNTRWLILTDNRITSLPERIGDLSGLQKLALAGNQLSELPNGLARCKNLELLRISANQLTEFPYLLLGLPRLAWLGFSGNPFCAPRDTHPQVPRVNKGDLQFHNVLGQGASGVISKASWLINTYDFPEEVAVKVFKGEVTSDGYPEDELDAYLSIGLHDNLVAPLAVINESDWSALVMSLIPKDYVNLGQPPSLETCTRDTFTQGQSFLVDMIASMVQQMESVVAHMEKQGIAHGDIYAHNVLIHETGHLVFGDFGAAAKYDHLPLFMQHGIQRIEQRALTHFIEDVLGLCVEEDRQTETYYALKRRMFNIKS